MSNRIKSGVYIEPVIVNALRLWRLRAYGQFQDYFFLYNAKRAKRHLEGGIIR